MDLRTYMVHSRCTWTKNGVRNLFVKGPAAFVELAYKDALWAIEYNGSLWGRTFFRCALFSLSWVVNLRQSYLSVI